VFGRLLEGRANVGDRLKAKHAPAVRVHSRCGPQTTGSETTYAQRDSLDLEGRPPPVWFAVANSALVKVLAEACTAMFRSSQAMTPSLPRSISAGAGAAPAEPAIARGPPALIERFENEARRVAASVYRG
jgi:hypothetical protein